MAMNYPYPSREKHKNPSVFLVCYTSLVVMLTIAAGWLIYLEDYHFAFGVAIFTTGVASFVPLIAFRRGEWNDAFKPYAIIFALNFIYFITLGIGAWNIPLSRFSYDLKISSLAAAELVVALFQFVMNFTYILALDYRSNKQQQLPPTPLNHNSADPLYFYQRDYRKFTFILFFIAAIYVVLRITLFSHVSSAQSGLDVELSARASYSLGFAFIDIFPLIICPSVMLCAVKQPKYRFGLYLILAIVFFLILQSFLRRELLCFFFTVFGSLVFFDRQLYQKISGISFIALPSIFLISFMGFILKFINSRAAKGDLDSVNGLIDNGLPEVYRIFTNSHLFNVVWTGFIDNVLMRFMGLDPIARIIEKDVFTAGQATIYSFLNVIPRFLWRDKPNIGGIEEEIIIRATEPSLSTDRAASFQMQMLADFGLIGLIIFAAIVGLLYAFIHRQFLRQKRDKFHGIYYFVLFGFIITQSFEGSLGSLFSSFRQVVIGFLIVLAIDKLFITKKYRIQIGSNPYQ